jgi:adenylate cyclase
VPAFVRVPALVGLLAGMAIAILFTLSTERMTTLREAVFDRMMEAGRSVFLSRPEGQIIVVDIDRKSLAEIGAWPWPRGEMAKLLDAILGQGAAAVALDIVFTGADQRSPGSVARRLAGETGVAELDRIAAALPDGDLLLAASLRNHPTILASLLDPRGAALNEAVPVLVRDAAELGEIWESAGAQLPIPELSRAASGLGVSSLPGDADGIIRRVPLVVRVGARIAPGLAAEAVRLATEASGYLATGPALMLTVGNAEVALPPNGMLRLLPPAVAPMSLRISAADLTMGRADGKALKDAIVFVGASAPELGGLRPSLLGPLTPSVDLHARAAWQVTAGISPLRIPWPATTEFLAAIAFAAVAVWLTLSLRPTKAFLAVLMVAGLILVAACLLAAGDRLMDPVPQLAALAGAFVATSGGAYAETRRREAKLRSRFEQHLAPGVVERIVAAPDVLKLAGERRCITALFTDIEGFSTTATAVTPEQLIFVLDSYFEGVASIIIRHGGMIDKFVGDAVHAFFNMPFDMDLHADQAVACACEIAHWTQAHRQEGLAGQIGLGRTRIGIETGDAVVGDVGFSTKLDYTAHGTAVNVAARLEALNKEYGTEICIGPGTAAACVQSRLRPLGMADVRGVGTLEVYTVQDGRQRSS